MLTLKEAGLTLKTINLLSYVGILPYRWNVATGKLERLHYYRLILWHFCVFLSAMNALNLIIQAMNLYVFSDHIDLPLHIVLIHIVWAVNLPIELALVIYMKTKVHDVTILFNQLFTGNKFSYSESAKLNLSSKEFEFMNHV